MNERPATKKTDANEFSSPTSPSGQNFEDNTRQTLLSLFHLDVPDDSSAIGRFITFKNKQITEFIKDVIIEDNSADNLEQLCGFFSQFYNQGVFTPKAEELHALSGENFDQYFIQTTGDPSTNSSKNATNNLPSFFIHKDLRDSLTRHLDRYLQERVGSLTELDPHHDVQQQQILTQIHSLKEFKGVAMKLIQELSRWENMLKILWEKKKLIYGVNYCMALNQIPQTFWSTVLQNARQISDWKENYGLDPSSFESFRNETRAEKFRSILETYSKLPVDTRFFDPSFVSEVIEAVSRTKALDSWLNGILIQSDNFHALQILLPKYRKQAHCIYIDPPYNTGNGVFLYGDTYEQRAWQTMMHNRLTLASQLLHEDGTLCISIDDNELSNLLMVIRTIFGDTSYKIIAVKVAEPTGVKMTHVLNAGGIAKLKEYLVIIKPRGLANFTLENVPKGKWDENYSTLLLDFTSEEADLIRRVKQSPSRNAKDILTIDKILQKITTVPVANYCKENHIPKENFNEWRYDNAWRIIRTVSTSKSAKKIADAKCGTTASPFFAILTKKKSLAIIKNGYSIAHSEPRIKILFASDYLSYHPGDFWADIKTTGLDKEGNITFTNGKKPEKLLQRIITMTTQEQDLVIDFFAGSGTSLAVAHKLGRRWIGVECNPYIETLTKRRLENVIKGDPSGIGKQVHWQGGGTFQYFALEQFEETLANLEIPGRNNSEFRNESLQENMIFPYYLDIQAEASTLRFNPHWLQTPFDCTLNILTPKGPKQQMIELLHSFSFWAGIATHTLFYRKNNGTPYLFAIGTQNNTSVLVIWRNLSPTADPTQEREFIQNEIPHVEDFHQIFINGHPLHPKAISLEKCFERAMFPSE